jgi:hypothetical protein
MANEIVFNVNTDACVVLVNKIEQLHKSALPLAIRGTLNSAAFDVKQRTLDESATQHFMRRSPTFFKRFSGVNRATGYNIDSMRAEVGMTAEGGGASEVKAQIAVANMEVQEEGGKIDKGLDYLAAARTSQSLDKTVTGKRRWQNANVVRGAFTKPGTAKSRLVAAAYVAMDTGKLQKTKINGRNFYRQVTAIAKTKKGKVKIKSKLIYVSRNGNIKPVSATHFSRDAAMRTQPLIPTYFLANAQRQIDRVWK